MSYPRVSSGDDVTAHEFNQLFEGMERLEGIQAHGATLAPASPATAEIQTDLSGNKTLLLGIPQGLQGTKGQDGKSILYKGEWNAATNYANTEAAMDLVKKDGNVYACKANNQGAAPPNTLYWDLFVPKGDDGSVAGGGNIKGLNVSALTVGKTYAVEAATIPSPGGILEGNLVEVAGAEDVQRKVEKNFTAFYDEKTNLDNDDIFVIQDSADSGTPKTNKRVKMSAIISAIYPIGSIYMTANPTNPSTYFGGIWAAWGAGRVPVGVDTGQAEFNAVEKTGGAKTQTLSEAQLPSHKHENFYMTIGDASPSANVVTVTSVAQSGATTQRAISGSVGYTGSGQAHNNLQPYIACYMWKRTA